MVEIWAGIDAGKREHHCVVIDADGTQLLSQRVINDEDTLLSLIAEVREIADGGHVTWAIDLNSGGAALSLTLLADHDQRVFYIPGRIIHHAAATYRGDVKDAAIIADQARMRRDLNPIMTSGQLSHDLRMVMSHRTDLIHDRVRTINRLRAVLLEYFPPLESAFDYSKSKAVLILLQGYQTPKALRALGEVRLAKWLHARGARNSSTVHLRAVNAAKAQHSTTPAQSYGQIRARSLAADLIRIDADLTVIEREITGVLTRHEHAEMLLSIPGFGPILAADFIANTGGDMSAFGTATGLLAWQGSPQHRVIPGVSVGTCTGQAKHQSDLGPTARPHQLPRTHTHNGLTTALRFLALHPRRVRVVRSLCFLTTHYRKVRNSNL